MSVNHSDTLRPPGRPGPNPPAQPPLWWSQSTWGLDGTCGEGGRHQHHPLPPTSRRPVLTCGSRCGERLAWANVCRISFRRGESYERRREFTVRKKRGQKEKDSMQTAHGAQPGSAVQCLRFVVNLFQSQTRTKNINKHNSTAVTDADMQPY